MSYEIDHRENLFHELKETHFRFEDVKSRLREQSNKLEELHREANECEREYNFLKRAVHLTITEDMDPVLAKFQISEELRKEPYDRLSKSPGLYAISSVEENRYHKSKVKRMLVAIREIWNER